VKARLGEKAKLGQKRRPGPAVPGLFSRDFYRRLSRNCSCGIPDTARAADLAWDWWVLPTGAVRASLKALTGLVELPLWLANNGAVKRSSRIWQAKNRTELVRKTVSISRNTIGAPRRCSVLGRTRELIVWCVASLEED
jgi:hypothetical protein